MKGGRERSGIASKTGLRVKWAAEVYDPPCTTVSHTVRDHRGRHHQRSSRGGKKDNYKNNKQHKGKSSKGSSSSYDRRKSGPRSPNAGGVMGPMDPRPLGAREEVLLDGRDAQLVAERLSDYAAAIGGQEAKCGGSRLLEEALSKVHLPIAS